MFNRPPHNLLKVQVVLGLLLPDVEFLSRLCSICPLEKQSYLSVSLLALVLVFVGNYALLCMINLQLVADCLVVLLNCFSQSILAGNKFVLPLFMGVVAPTFNASLFLEEV